MCFIWEKRGERENSIWIANMKLWKREMNKCSNERDGNWKFRVHFHSFLLNARASLSPVVVRCWLWRVWMFEIWNMFLLQKERKCIFIPQSSSSSSADEMKNVRNFRLCSAPAFSSVRYWRVSFNSCDVLLFLWKLHASTTLNRQTSMLNWKLHLFHSLSCSSSLARPEKFPPSRWIIDDGFSPPPKNSQAHRTSHNMMQSKQQKEELSEPNRLNFSHSKLPPIPVSISQHSTLSLCTKLHVKLFSLLTSHHLDEKHVSDAWNGQFRSDGRSDCIDDDAHANVRNANHIFSPSAAWLISQYESYDEPSPSWRSWTTRTHTWCDKIVSGKHFHLSMTSFSMGKWWPFVC